MTLDQARISRSGDMKWGFTASLFCIDTWMLQAQAFTLLPHYEHLAMEEFMDEVENQPGSKYTREQQESNCCGNKKASLFALISC